MASRGRAVPYIVAGITGIFSGIYIFQPLLSAEKAKSQNGAEAKPSIVAPQDDASVAHKSMTSES
ncbi:hypothetical protein AB1N83_003818 [Pleurotus pulmonarius]